MTSILLGSIPARARIAIFRALQLGDMLCVMPAIKAIRRVLPQAEITLIGLPSAQTLATRYADLVDVFMPFPGHPAFPEQAPQLDALPGFYAAARARAFDLALQLHGSGNIANGIVRQLHAKRWAGFVPPGARTWPGRRMTWPDSLPEPLRYLALVQEMGAPASDSALFFPLSNADEEEADRLCSAHDIQPENTIFLHPGARLRSRRWSVARFQTVGRVLSERGWRLAITGSVEEREITATLLNGLSPDTVDLTGRTSLGGLAALIARARLLICNDTGISHIAAAVRTPSVVVASGSDPQRWAPLDRKLHDVCFHPIACRPCAYEDCPIGHPCALGVAPDEVLLKAYRKLQLRYEPKRLGALA